MLKNIVFDMGNVLLVYNPYQACLRYARDPEKAQLLLDAIFETPQWWELIDGGVLTDVEYIPNAQSRLETPELRQLAAQVLTDWYLDGLYPMPGMETVVESLLAQGYRLFLLSNVGHSFHDFAYKMPYLRRFEGVVLSCEERVRKPDPVIFRRLCARYGLTPAQTLFVDDLPANVEGARQAGWQGHCFDHGDPARLLAAIDALAAR